MIRLSSLCWLLLVAVTGFTTFKLKYTVQDIEDELSRVRKQTIVEQQEIRLLTAEWTSLNQPDRLADLNRRILGLAPMAARQLQRSIEEIPLRPGAAAAPDALVAAAPPTVAAQPAAARGPAAVQPKPAPLKPAPAATPSLQLAKAAQPPRSLDQLISDLAGVR